MATLRREVASLRLLLFKKDQNPATIDSDAVAAVAAREAAKQKRIEEREAAKQKHAAFVAKQALIQPEKDRARAEWLAKDAARKRGLKRILNKKWRAENPEKAKAASERWRAANPERDKTNKYRWKAANPEKVKASRARYCQKREVQKAAGKQRPMSEAPVRKFHQ
jgi:hypothetical protein